MFQRSIAFVGLLVLGACSDASSSDAETQLDATVFLDALSDAGIDAELDAGLDAGAPDADALDAEPDAAPRTTMVDFDDESAALSSEMAYTAGVLVGDLDNDADPDLIFLNGPTGPMFERRGGIIISLNLGARSFSTNEVVQTSTTGARSWLHGATGDLDGDGDLDLVVSRGVEDARTQIGAFFNDGTGTFTASVAAVPELRSEVYGLHYGGPALGDLDDDGDLDIVLPMFYELNRNDDVPNLLLINDGRGHFALDGGGRLPSMPDNTNYSAVAAIGDVDGDRDLDIFLGSYSRLSHLLINDGTGYFTEDSARLPRGFLLPYFAKLIDLDGDADLDIVTSNVKSGEQAIGTRLLINDGTGRFAPERLRQEREHNTAGFAFTDLDGDGLKDWVIGNVGAPDDGNGIQIMFGRPDGEPEAATSEPMINVPVKNIVAADFDGDGLQDLVLGTYETPDVLLFGKASP